MPGVMNRQRLPRLVPRALQRAARIPVLGYETQGFSIHRIHFHRFERMNEVALNGCEYRVPIRQVRQQPKATPTDRSPIQTSFYQPAREPHPNMPRYLDIVCSVLCFA
jgi:hypothetical protein